VKRFAWAALVLLLAASFAAAQKLPWQKSERPQDVRYLFPEQVSVPAGKDAVVELHFRINSGMHINSHTPSEKGLIPTSLILPENSGVKLDKVDFPSGSEYSLRAMPSMKLSVYTGDFVARAHIRAISGQHLVQAALRYQACDVNACYPPRKAPVVVDVIAK
jgi:DsbC/DsbD-like thiol-disulfide interchange protein